MVVVVVVVVVVLVVVVLDVDVDVVGGGPVLTLSRTTVPFFASDAPGGDWSNTFPASTLSLTWFTVVDWSPAASIVACAASTGWPTTEGTVTLLLARVVVTEQQPRGHPDDREDEDDHRRDPAGVRLLLRQRRRGRGLARHDRGHRSRRRDRLTETIEIGRDLVGVVIAAGDVRRREALDDRVERRRHRRDRRRRRERSAIELVAGDGDRVAAAERRGTGGRLVEQHAEGVEVAARVRRSTLQPLRGSVDRRLDRRLGDAGDAGRAAAPKSVTLTDPSRPSSTSRGIRLPCTAPARCAAPRARATVGTDRGDAVEPEALGPHRVGEARPVDVLHDHEGADLGLRDVEHAHDVRIPQRRRRRGHAAEALGDVRVARAVGGQRLDRDLTVELAVACEEDLRGGGGPDVVSGSRTDRPAPATKRPTSIRPLGCVARSVSAGMRSRP